MENRSDTFAYPNVSINFYARRSEPFVLPNSQIVFSDALVNQGGAFGVLDGTFRPPAAGIYRFSFSGVRDKDSPALVIILRHVSGTQTNNVAEAYCSEIPNTYTSCSLDAIVEMAVRDTVYLFNSGNGVLYDSSNHVTQFTGSLLDQ